VDEEPPYYNGRHSYTRRNTIDVPKAYKRVVAMMSLAGTGTKKSPTRKDQRQSEPI
jgi:hypothetical protein